MSLTTDEHKALDLTAQLSNLLMRLDVDREWVRPMHEIQNAILANSAAREYPHRYRLGNKGTWKMEHQE